MGLDDLQGHRLEYFLPGVASFMLICLLCALVGFAFDHSGSFADSDGAGLGGLVGLILWLGLVFLFVANGGGERIRKARRARRHEEHVAEVRSRRNRQR